MVFQDMVLRGKTQKYVDTDQEDNLNELRLEISQVWFGDKNLIIRCNNLQSPEMSGPVPPSGQCWSSVKLLSHIAYTYKLVLSCWVVTSPKQIFVLTQRLEVCSILRYHKWMDAHALLFTNRQLCILCWRCTHTCTLSDALSDSRAPRVRA